MTRIQTARPLMLLEPVWRLFNFGLFVAALIGPWGTMFGDVISGAQFLKFQSFFIADLFDPAASKYLNIFDIQYFLLELCFIAYWVTNMIFVIKRRAAKDYSWPLRLVILIALLLLSDLSLRLFSSRFSRFWWPELYWGYWLLLLGLGSALALELIRYWLNRMCSRNLPL